MNIISSAARQLVKLFVDDGALALTIIAIVTFAALLSVLVPEFAGAAGAILVLGCAGALLGNVLRSSRRLTAR
jgi:hypothetical protein